MLYSFIAVLILLFLFAILTPYMCYWCFAKGYNVNAEKVGVAPIKTPKRPVKTVNLTAEQQELLDLMEAIEEE